MRTLSGIQATGEFHLGNCMERCASG